MQRRRGLISQSSHPAGTVHKASDKPETAGESQESCLSSSESSGFSSSDSESEQPRQEVPSATSQVDNPPEQHTAEEIVPDDGLDREERSRHPRKGAKTKNKDKPDYSDENRWKKMKLKGSDKEIMVDMTRVQRYVDYDSAGVTSFQQEVQQAKGNFRQQQMADYSDL